jgi:hypothetical protein
MSESRTVIQVIRRNARESLEISINQVDGVGPMLELRRLYVPLRPDEPPRLMENGLSLSVSTRHLPELARAFMGAAQRAAEMGLLPVEDQPSNKVEKSTKSKRAA